MQTYTRKFYRKTKQAKNNNSINYLKLDFALTYLEVGEKHLNSKNRTAGIVV